MKHLILLSWAFIVLNGAGEPYWKLCCMATLDDCEKQRQWIQAEGKKAGPCFQERITQLQQ